MTFVFQWFDFEVIGSEELPAGLASRHPTVSRAIMTELDRVPEGQLKSTLRWYLIHLGPEMLDHVYISRLTDSRPIMSIRDMCHALGVEP